MQLNRRSLGALTLITLLLQACSHVLSKKDLEDPSVVAREICVEENVSREVTGSIWMKAKSKEASGQFPASVQVKAYPSSPLELRLEIKQLLGARAALIEVRGNDFKIETAKDGTITRKASSWGGIPLEWASQLFLDRFPCPTAQELKSLSWKWLGSNELEGKPSVGDVVWRFKLRRWNFRPWVESIFWQKAAGKTLEIKRDDPDPQQGWAQRWEVTSPSGQVKIRWKDRKIQ